MANPTFDLHSAVSGDALGAAGRGSKAAARRASRPPLAVLAPGESAAHPPEAPAHWDLGPRVALMAGLVLLSWGAVVAAVVLLAHH